jgi:hypothetical protein
MDKKNPNVLRVSFKDNEFEMKLLNDIKQESIIVGDSAWMKLAAYEKLQRDKSKIINTTPIQKSGINIPIINDLSELFNKGLE